MTFTSTADAATFALTPGAPPGEHHPDRATRNPGSLSVFHFEGLPRSFGWDDVCVDEAETWCGLTCD